MESAHTEFPMQRALSVSRTTGNKSTFPDWVGFFNQIENNNNKNQENNIEI